MGYSFRLFNWIGVLTLFTLNPSTFANEINWKLPQRAQKAQQGSQFLESLKGLPHGKIEAKILREIAGGNVPEFLRKLVPVAVNLKSGGTATVYVTPDYIGVGDSENFVRLPMSLPAAMKLARQFGLSLPNKVLVDAIYNQANLKLRPRPLPPVTSKMTKPAYWAQHHSIISRQLNGQGYTLLAGHKKDILQPSLRGDPRLTIYGWHRSHGNPIQPESRAHGKDYVDYSHGVRLVSKKAFLNGRMIPLNTVLKRLSSSQPKVIGDGKLW